MSIKVSARSIRIRIGKIPTLAMPVQGIYAAPHKARNTAPDTIHKRSASRGRYWSLSFFRRIRAPVATRRIIRNKMTPLQIPVARNATESSAGVKIPAPRIPIKCRAAATIATTSGKSKMSTTVFTGTSWAIAASTA